MTKRIITSSMMSLFALALIVGGTGAFFTDTETSTGNVFTAGNIDLFINHTAQSYNGVNCQTCGVTLFSSTNTQVVSSNAVAATQISTPQDAALVASPHPNWFNASNLPDAEWIWVTPSVDPQDTTNNAEYTFEDTFFIQGPASLANFEFQFASDNGYRIELNGTEIVDNLALDNNFSSLNSVQQTAFEAALVPNTVNTLSFTIRNLAGNSNPNNNPAGLLYRVELSTADCEPGVEDYQQTCQLWNSTNLTNEQFFNFSDIKPQDDGTNLISMTVESNESYLCLAFNNIDEVDADGASGEGSMGEFMQVAGWVADEFGNTSGSPLFGPSTLDDVNPMTYADSTGSPVTPGETQYMLLAWCYGDMELTGTPGEYTCDGNVTNINDTQGEQLITDLQFFAIQSRNNGDFTCDMANFGVSQPPVTTQTIQVNQSELNTNITDFSANPLAWYFFRDGGNEIMDINTDTPNGNNEITNSSPVPTGSTGGAAYMRLPNSTERYNIATNIFGGTALSGISSLNYRILDGTTTSETPYLHFNVSFDGTESWQNRLVMVPTAPGNAGVTSGVWTVVDALNSGNAVWCWSGMPPCGGSATEWPTQASGFEFTDPTAPYQTWNDIVAAYPGAIMNTGVFSFLGVRVGHPGPAGAEGFVDWVEFNGTTYNFTE